MLQKYVAEPIFSQHKYLRGTKYLVQVTDSPLLMTIKSKKLKRECLKVIVCFDFDGSREITEDLNNSYGSTTHFSFWYEARHCQTRTKKSKSFLKRCQVDVAKEMRGNVAEATTFIKRIIIGGET